MKILVVRFSSLGDIILTSPVITNLKIKYPDSHLTFLCKDKFTGTVKLIDGVDEIISIPDKISLLAYFKFLNALRKNGYNYIIDLHKNIRSWWALKLISADKKVVYQKRRLERELIVKNKQIPKEYPHTIDLYNAALKSFDCDVFSSRPILKKSPVTENRFCDFQKNNPEYITIAPGASYETKKWPLDRFVEVAEDLYDAHKIGVVWVVTSADSKIKGGSSEIPNTAQFVCRDYPIDQLSGIIASSKITIANDSGISHLSSSVGTPVLTLFGPTHPALGFYPKGLLDRVVHTTESCRPCSLHGGKECYREERFCFTKITSRRVSNLADTYLKDKPDGNRAAFVDRDGTIIVDKHFLSDPDEIEFEQNAIEGLLKLQNAGYKIVIISNQSGVARGHFGVEQVDIVNARLVEMLAAEHVLVDAVYFCPHYEQGSAQPYNIRCNCRKPAPGMAYEAVHQLGLDLRNSIVIGDKISDLNFGKVIGARSILVKTGYGQKSLDKIRAIDYYTDIVIAENIHDTAIKIEDK